MIPGYPTNTSYRTIAEREYGILSCSSAVGCRKELSREAHRKGQVDRAGWIHWDRIDHRSIKRGMRPFLKLVAMSFNREWWAEPVWHQLYLTNTWATREARHRFHFLMYASWSNQDRLKVGRMIARRRKKLGSIRYNHRGVYNWLKYLDVDTPGLYTRDYRWEQRKGR